VKPCTNLTEAWEEKNGNGMVAVAENHHQRSR